MPTTWLKVAVQSESLVEEVVGGVGGYTNAKAGRVFRCQAAAPVALEEALTADDGTRAVAAIGSAFSTLRPNCVVTRREPKRVSARVVDVACDFLDLTGGETSENLLLKPARLVKLSVQSEMQEYTKDTEKKRVWNTAYEPFDKNPERLKCDFIFHIEKYVDAGGMGVLAAAHETTNQGAKTISGIGVTADWGLLLLEDFQPVGTSGIYLANYQVCYRRDGWVDKVVDAGLREVNPDADGGSGSDYYRPIVREGEPVTKPWPLDGAGTALAVGFDPASTADGGDVHELEFRPYAKSAWTGVGLPT